MNGRPNIILVHGAWADGSSWSKVIPLLAHGLAVTAVQLPLTSLADDVATVKRAIALVDGPAVLVGHCYGGVVISEAGTDSKVTGLVFIAGLPADRDHFPQKHAQQDDEHPEQNRFYGRTRVHGFLTYCARWPGWRTPWGLPPGSRPT